jgi:DNA-binding MurR/RpiR family transcriptional regulator
MYVPYMKSVNYPIAWPVDFLSEFKQAAEDAGVSTAAAIRRSTKLGLPKFRQETARGRVTNVDPLPDRVARELYAEREDDSDSIRRIIAAQPKDAR